jgi:hypothetical protein
MFYNIKLDGDNKKGNILAFYNIFVINIESILETIKQEDDYPEDLYIVKRRKLSVPDNLLKNIPLEGDSAYNENTKMYESFEKTIFNHSSAHNKVTPFSHKSCMVSPMLSRSVTSSATNLQRTPRTNRVRDFFKEIDHEKLIQNDDITLNMSNKDTNVFRDRLISRLNSNNLSNNVIYLYYLYLRFIIF